MTDTMPKTTRRASQGSQKTLVDASKRERAVKSQPTKRSDAKQKKMPLAAESERQGEQEALVASAKKRQQQQQQHEREQEQQQIRKRRRDDSDSSPSPSPTDGSDSSSSESPSSDSSSGSSPSVSESEAALPPKKRSKAQEAPQQKPKRLAKRTRRPIRTVYETSGPSEDDSDSWVVLTQRDPVTPMHQGEQEKEVSSDPTTTDLVGGQEPVPEIERETETTAAMDVEPETARKRPRKKTLDSGPSKDLDRLAESLRSKRVERVCLLMTYLTHLVQAKHLTAFEVRDAKTWLVTYMTLHRVHGQGEHQQPEPQRVVRRDVTFYGCPDDPKDRREADLLLGRTSHASRRPVDTSVSDDDDVTPTSATTATTTTAVSDDEDHQSAVHGVLPLNEADDVAKRPNVAALVSDMTLLMQRWALMLNRDYLVAGGSRADRIEIRLALAPQTPAEDDESREPVSLESVFDEAPCSILKTLLSDDDKGKEEEDDDDDDVVAVPLDPTAVAAVRVPDDTMDVRYTHATRLRDVIRRLERRPDVERAIDNYIAEQNADALVRAQREAARQQEARQAQAEAQYEKERAEAEAKQQATLKALKDVVARFGRAVNALGAGATAPTSETSRRTSSSQGQTAC